MTGEQLNIARKVVKDAGFAVAVIHVQQPGRWAR